MNVKANLLQIKNALPSYCTLIAVSKSQPLNAILEAYQAGHRDFGENYVKELVNKYNELPKDINWHFIGHLQTNKVKHLVPFVYLIQSVDSKKLLTEINKEAGKKGRKINVLLQVYIASEETKYGLSEKELMEIINEYESKKYANILIKGLMGMASNTSDTNKIKEEFSYINSLFQNLRLRLNDIDTLSIGMSNDYPIAIANGSTMVRIGSAIFGERTQTQLQKSERI